MSRIKKLFASKSEKVIPFLTAGFPQKSDTINLVREAESAGASMIELGMPFSDPLADGPIIQRASQVAIENGVTIQWILDTVSEIRSFSQIPIVLMGYINPIIKFGLEKFMAACNASGVDGLIIPDLPPEEAEEFIRLGKKNNVSPILLVAPNTDPTRIAQISKMAGDLIYCVAILGITGTSANSEKNLGKYLLRVKENSHCPYVVGFGIKNREDVVEINKLSDGAVVGSAIIKEMEGKESPEKIVKSYIERLVG
jgi:tryptophan synthase alpha chain